MSRACRNVEKILAQLQPEIDERCGDCKPLVFDVKWVEESAFDRFRRSQWAKRVRNVKYWPLVGPVLLFVKRKVLKWEV